MPACMCVSVFSSVSVTPQAGGKWQLQRFHHSGLELQIHHVCVSVYFVLHMCVCVHCECVCAHACMYMHMHMHTHGHGCVLMGVCVLTGIHAAVTIVGNYTQQAEIQILHPHQNRSHCYVFIVCVCVCVC